METVNIVGVQFRRAGRIYHFTPGGLDVRIGDQVVVDTDRGPSLAQVTTLKLLDRADVGSEELKPLMRKATEKDLDSHGKLTPEFAESFAREALKRHTLDIRILKAEVQLGGNKVVIYFSSPGRVDFRELVKDLATGLFARVELKQVGSRDEAKLVGGLGICGREFCCSSFLREFVPVSIKMAKNQNLALNPTKVSGGCGRLLCCLTYENDTYSELRKTMPGKGARVRVIDDGLVASVIKSDLINQLVMIVSEDGNIQTLPVSQLEVLEREGRPPQGGKGQQQAKGSSRDRAEEVQGDEDLSEAEVWAEDINLEELGFGEGESPDAPQPQSDGQHSRSAGQQRGDGGPDKNRGRRGRGRRN
jgi:cell fate regulator YaaT (PSP1 superfamily)